MITNTWETILLPLTLIPLPLALIAILLVPLALPPPVCEVSCPSSKDCHIADIVEGLNSSKNFFESNRDSILAYEHTLRDHVYSRIHESWGEFKIPVKEHTYERNDHLRQITIRKADYGLDEKDNAKLNLNVPYTANTITMDCIDRFAYDHCDDSQRTTYVVNGGSYSKQECDDFARLIGLDTISWFPTVHNLEKTIIGGVCLLHHEKNWDNKLFYNWIDKDS